MSEKDDNIAQLAEQYMNEEGQEWVGNFLLESNPRSTKICILGTIDSLWRNKRISDDKAAVAYRKLDIDHDTVARIRQQSTMW